MATYPYEQIRKLKEEEKKMTDDYREWDYADAQDAKKERNDLIELCAGTLDEYAKSEKEESLRFSKLAKKEPSNPQWKIAQATHAVMSVMCERIANDIRLLKR